MGLAVGAVRKGVAAHNSEAGDIARSRLGGLVEKLLNAQYSQQEEREADDEGIAYLRERKADPNYAVTALTKLAARGGGGSLLSSHPAAEARAERMKAQLDAPSPSPTLMDRIKGWAGALLRYILGLFD